MFGSLSKMPRIASCLIVSLFVFPLVSSAAPFDVTNLPDSVVPVRLLPSGPAVVYKETSDGGAHLSLFTKGTGLQDLGNGEIPLDGAYTLRVNTLGDGVFSASVKLSPPYENDTKKLVLRERDGTLHVLVPNDETLLNSSCSINDSRRVAVVSDNDTAQTLHVFDSSALAFSVPVAADFPSTYVLDDGRVLIRNVPDEETPKPHLVVSSAGVSSELDPSVFAANAEVVDVRPNSTVVFQSEGKLFVSDLVNPAQQLSIDLGSSGRAVSVNPSNATLAVKDGVLAYLTPTDSIDSINCSFLNRKRLSFYDVSVGGVIADDGSFLVGSGSLEAPRFSILTPTSLAEATNWCPTVKIAFNSSCRQLYRRSDSTGTSFEAAQARSMQCTITVRARSSKRKPLKGLKARIANLGAFVPDGDGGYYPQKPRVASSSTTNSAGIAKLVVQLDTRSRDYQVDCPYRNRRYHATSIFLRGVYE